MVEIYNDSCVRTGGVSQFNLVEDIIQRQLRWP